MRVLLSLSESTPCSHCHISNLCDFHISIALLTGARSNILELVALTHAQFLIIFRELLNPSRTPSSSYQQRASEYITLLKAPHVAMSHYAAMPICFALYFESLGSKFHLTSPKHLSIHGARLIHHITETLLPTFCSSACCFVQAPLSPQ